METQEKIVNKAHELFFRYGVKSISMDEIATGAGVSKKTIYQFFADKDALVDAVMDIELNRSITDCVQNNLLYQNAVQEVLLGLELASEMLTLMNPSLMYELEKYHPKTFKRFADYKNKFIFQLLKTNLEKGRGQGLYRKDFDIEIVARYRVSTIFLIFNTEIFPHGKHSLIEILKETTEIFLYGIVTPKGRRFITKYKSKKGQKV